MPEVESLEGHYFELRGKLSTSAITPAEYRNQVARLWFEDATGHTWMIGAQTGHWYVYKDDQWTMGDPPREHETRLSITCPRCGETVDAEAQFCGHCSYRLNELQSVAIERVEGAPVLDVLPPAPIPALRIKQIAKAVPAAERSSAGPSRNLLLALSGAALFGVLFLCLGTVGGLLLLRNGAAANAGLTSPSSTLTARGTATSARSATPIATPPRTTLAIAVTSPTGTATPLVVASIAAQVNPIAPTKHQRP